jgi:hypothetical protein
MIRVESNEPAVSISESIVAHGALIGEDDSVDLPHVQLSRSRNDWPEPWNLTAHPSPQDSRKVQRLMDEERRGGRLRIECKTEVGETFVIRDTLLLGSRGRELQLKVHQFEHGLAELPAMPSEQYLSATLTPTNFAFERPDPRGPEPRRFQVNGPLFTWSSTLGTLTLERAETNARVRLNGRAQNVDVPAVWLRGSVHESRLTLRPQELLAAFETEVRWLLATLDLLDRRRTFWSELRVSSRSTTDGAFDETAGRWRTVHPTEPPEYLEPLVWAGRAAVDLPGRMAETLAAFEYRDRLAIAIAFMSSAHGDGYLEEKVMAAFAAFEATISGLPSPDDPDRDQVRNLQDELRVALDSLPATGTVSPAVVERVRHRLSLLPDVPLARRAALLVERYGVAWQDLWPGGELEAELRKALRIRNAIFHTGHLTMGFAARPESERVLVLTERLLFAALGGAGSDVHARAYRHVEWILREIAERAASPA